MNALEVHHITKIFSMHPQYRSRMSLRQAAYHALNPFNVFKNTKTQFSALQNISFTVKKGETVGIIGNNGSGKSTLLRMIAGITLPTKGEIVLSGKVVPLFTLGLGFHYELTGRENIYLNAAILGYARQKVEQEIPSIIAFSELNQFIDTPVKYYSSGMYARLGFAIATAKNLEPDILLLDETLAVGDITFKKKAYTRLKELAKSKKTTVLFVHHDLTFVEALCTQCLWIDKGKLMAFGKTKNVIQAYTKYSQNPLLTTA